MAPLCCAAKFDPFLSLECTPTPSTLAQSKERKGSNFAIWQPCRRVREGGAGDPGEGLDGQCGHERERGAGFKDLQDAIGKDSIYRMNMVGKELQVDHSGCSLGVVLISTKPSL